jgi:hypothetical protein
VRAVVIALVVAIAAIWFVWTIGGRLLLGVLRRASLPNEISWSRVMPVMFIVLFASMSIAACAGSWIGGIALRFG